MKLFRIRFSYLYICFSFFFAAALWYTVKIDCLDRAGELKEAGRALLDFWDVPILLLGTAFFSLLLPKLVDRLSGFSCSRRTAADRTWFLPAFLLMTLWQLPFLLSFYPAPGMNDTVFMMEKGRASLWILAVALLAMLLRSNGLLVALLVSLALFFLEKRKEILLFFVIFALISIIPAQVIQRTHHWEPLFQESMAIPLQQLGRTMVLGGERSEETKTLMENLLTEEEWKKEYSPYTVDFVKWHDHFHRNWLNGQKKEFLSAWVDTGLRNPRIYVEGWLTETYALWNLDPFEYGVQSRFGWALSDENTKDMKPADNDRMATGNFPLPLWLKARLANVSYEGSHFIGTGFSLWITLFLGLVWIRQGKKEYLWAILPLLVNTATLLLSTPASSVFRYSFAYVLCLPVLGILTVVGRSESEG